MPHEFRRGLSVILARRAGVSCSYLSAIINRKKRCGAEIAVRLARAARWAHADGVEGIPPEAGGTLWWIERGRA